MSLIDREATFRGRIVDHAVSTTKNKFPQLVASLVAEEIYDEDEKVWVDWKDQDEKEITAYLILFGSKGETLTCEQVKKAVGWDGVSFAGLNDMDLSQVKIQFTTEWNTFNEKTSIQVRWIDEKDAGPGRTVRKLDKAEMKELDAKYAQQLKATAAGKAPAKPGKVTAKGVKATQPKGPVTKKSTPPTLPKKSTPPVPSAPPLPGGKCSQQEAWDSVLALRDEKIGDEELAGIWGTAVLEIGEGKDQAELTEDQWFLVKEKVMEQTAKF